MFGIVYFIWALLGYIANTFNSVEIQFGANCENEQNQEFRLSNPQREIGEEYLI